MAAFNRLMMEPMVADRGEVGRVRARNRKIRVLFLGANPAGTTRLALDREVREITQRLRATPHYDRFEIIQEWAVRVDDLQAALLRHAPQIVHFSGHGFVSLAPPQPRKESRNLHRDIESSDMKPDAAAGGEILIEDALGKPVGISATALTELLQLVGSVRCVVLNACYSASQSAAFCKQADCVIGMTSAIPDSTAIAFAWAFYQALGFGESVETAFAFGCNQIALGKLPGAELPELVLRDGTAAERIRLIDPVQWSPRFNVFGIGTLLIALVMAIGLRSAGSEAPALRHAARDVMVAPVAPPEPPPGMVWIPPADVVLGTTATELRELRRRCVGVAGEALCTTYDKIGFWDREPRRRAHVDGFFLDRTEVTAGEVVAWLTAAGASVQGTEIHLDGVVVAHTGKVIETDGAGFRAKPGLSSLPVVDVTWDGARLYCGARGATLPTGMQWERAARRADGAAWPWGDAPPTCFDAVLARGPQRCPGELRMQLPNHARRDQTRDEVLDLIGNVSEWVLDEGPGLDLHEIRGGSYISNWLQARPAARVFAADSAEDLGFRCAKGFQ